MICLIYILYTSFVYTYLIKDLYHLKNIFVLYIHLILSKERLRIYVNNYKYLLLIN